MNNTSLETSEAHLRSTYIITFYCVQYFEAVLSITGNTLLLVSIIKFRNLQTCANMILFSLAVSDICSSLTGTSLPTTVAVLQCKYKIIS